MPYADYAFYTGTYKGKRIPEADYPTAAHRASAYLDVLTFGRIPTTVTDDMKNAMCAAADAWYETTQAGGVVAQETTGSYSVAYKADGQSLRQRMRDAAALYLANTGLLYRGVYVHE